MGSPEPPYGERVVSWRAVYDELEPDLDAYSQLQLAAEMHRLRGLVMAQAGETEAALGQVLSVLDPLDRATQENCGTVRTRGTPAVTAGLSVAVGRTPSTIYGAQSSPATVSSMQKSSSAHRGFRMRPVAESTSL